MININNIHKSFLGKQVLSGIDLQIKKGEIVVILGASGSGKTTFLRCLNALDIPDKGTIQFLDKPPLTIDFTTKVNKRALLKLRRKSGMVFQQYHLFINKTILENITLAPLVVQNYPLKKATDIAEQLLDKVGLADKANSYPQQLSGGQQQRIGIARALAIAPDLLLFDEPTSALDPELVGEVLQVMRCLAKEGQTMVIVTHEIQFAKEVADKIIFIDKGKIIQQGAVKSILDNPKNPRVQRFLRRLQHTHLGN